MSKEGIQSIVDTALEEGIKVSTEIYTYIEEQVPQYIDEIVRWGIVYNSIPVISSLVVFIAVMIFVKKNNGFMALLNHTEPIIVPILTIAVLSAVLFCTTISDFLKPIIAPRLYVIEQIAELLK